MARTIDEIKQEMTAHFMAQPAVISAYGLDGMKAFKDVFSPASLESIFFYVFAVSVWTLEKLFDLHSSEVDARIERLEPHTLRWYVGKAKAYLHGWPLVSDADYYDTSSLTDTQMSEKQIIKYAVATESNTVVYLKVATQRDGQPQKLTDAQLSGLTSYINTVKDAGVSVHIRSEKADEMKIGLHVFYDPTLLTVTDGVGEDADGRDPVTDAVRDVITNLPFNGVFRKSDMMAALQALPCVQVVDISGVQVKPQNAPEWITVDGFHRPYSGYYSIEELDVNYEPYNAVEQ